MDREGFRNRLKQYKKAREENPGLKYWEWKDIPKYEDGTGGGGEPSIWNKFTNAISVLYNNAARKVRNFFEDESAGEVIDLSDKKVSRITPDTKNLTAIYGNEFVENNTNNIRTRKQFEETTDTLIGDKKIPLSKISTFYGIEDGKLKAGNLSTFDENTTVVPNRAKNIGKVKKIYKISHDSPEYQWAKAFDEQNKSKIISQRDSLTHAFLDSLNIPYNDAWYASFIGESDAREAVMKMYHNKNTNESTKKYIRDVVWNTASVDQKRANRILSLSQLHFITEKNDTLSIRGANVFGPKYMFADESGNSMFVYRPTALSDQQLDSLNVKLEQTPMYPILIDNGRYSHY